MAMDSAWLRRMVFSSDLSCVAEGRCKISPSLLIRSSTPKRKPEPAIYLRTLDILGCKPERALFIDDRELNVDGGAAAGMKAIQFTGADALRAALEELGVF